LTEDDDHHLVVVDTERARSSIAIVTAAVAVAVAVADVVVPVQTTSGTAWSHRGWFGIGGGWRRRRSRR
jgi:hypothetical protein